MIKANVPLILVIVLQDVFSLLLFVILDVLVLLIVVIPQLDVKRVTLAVTMRTHVLWTTVIQKLDATTKM
jgi:uncharacterized membrane protein